MFTKVVLVFCVQALFVQSALSQCTSRIAVTADPGIYGLAGYGLGAPYGFGAPALGAAYGFADAAYGAPCGAPWGLGAFGLEFAPTSGGALPISSVSPVPPTGISVVSDNIFEGPLAVAGELPFVGTVGLDGVLPSYGAGAINHACGNGVSAMVYDDSTFTPDYVGAYAPGLIAPTLGYPA